MSSIFRILDLSIGADGGAPTPLILCSATTSYFNSKLVGLAGDIFDAHVVGLVLHEGVERQIVIGSTTMFFEGKSVARSGDLISDGDICGVGSEDSFAGG